MHLSELEKWGMPVQVIRQWRKRQGELLLPVQVKAVRKGLVGKPGERQGDRPVRMLISAPTSSGKSFCAELAAIRTLGFREKVVMLFPLKSLAEQKHKLFQETYGQLGVECLIVTSDHPENDHLFRDGKYQIATAIYEKVDQLLTCSPDTLRNIGLVVVDEIQSIGEARRGAVLERLLTKIRVSEYEPSILGLSAVIGDETESAGRLAEWLDATLVEENSRPVDLMRGVAADGSYRYRLFNNGEDGIEPFVATPADDDPFTAFIEQVKDSDASTLVFLKSRMNTVDAAFKLAARVKWSEASRALSELESEEPSFLIRSLRQALGRGVAFHNSDLSPRQRSIVEQAFLNKEVKTVFSTTTLAMGINLFADVVYLETVKYAGGTYGCKPSLVPVTRSEFDNMSGRAGRLGPDRSISKPGRAVVLASSDFDREILWRSYIAGDNPESVTSAFNSLPLSDWLLDLIGSGLVQSRGQAVLRPILEQTFFGFSGGIVTYAQCEQALESLSGERLIETDQAAQTVYATPLGKAVLKAGLSVEQTVHYRRKLTQGVPETLSGWLALALSGPGWDLPPAILTRREHAANLPVRMLHQNFENLIDEVDLIVDGRSLRQSVTFRQAAIVKAFLILHLWQDLTPIQTLEERFQIHLGQVLSLGDTASYLVSGLSELVRETGSSSSPAERLRDYAWSLRYGMPAHMRPMRSCLASVLNRRDFHALRQAGLETMQNLLEVDPESVKAVLRDSAKLPRLSEKLEQLRKEFAVQLKSAVVESHPGAVMPAIAGKPESIEIDGSYERERYLVRINGFPVRLTGKSFKYFTKLAWSRMHRDSGWIYKEDIEVGFNQARYLYRMKGEICAGLNVSWPVIENNRLGYYRLNADPCHIRINVQNLKSHPDYEVRSLFLN